MMNMMRKRLDLPQHHPQRAGDIYQDEKYTNSGFCHFQLSNKILQ